MAERTRIVLQRLGLSLLAPGAVLAGLSCGGGDIATPTTGSIAITTTTSGPEPDADGYTVSIDDEAQTAVGANASLQRDNLDPGSHSVRLAGMAANCTLEGQNPRSVAVTGDAMAEVSFVITCHATTGSLEVTSTTTGPSPDPDGYTITLDGTDRGTLVASGAVTLDGLATGSHAVGLSGIAANCQVQGDNPQIVTVTAGASVTAAFAISCTAPPPITGSLRITTATTGPEQDPNGYAFTIDAGGSQTIGVSATATLANVGAGAHTVRLSGVSANCIVQGTDSRSVTVSGGATAEVSFTVTCVATTGSLVITTTTTGNTPDLDGYMVAVDNAAPQTIGPTATLAVPGVSPGDHRVTLSGWATNCQVQGDNPRSVTVTAGATATAAFSIDCHSTLIAFTRGNSGIYVMRADGSGQTKLTDGSSPAWSPDGTQIAFSRNSDIYIMNADGAGQRRLTSASRDDSPTWSPDGTKIAFVRFIDVPESYSSYSQIMIVNADGTGAPRVIIGFELYTYYTDPDWSRDGSRLAFTGSPDQDVVHGPPRIGIMNADGSGEGTISDYDTCSYGPAWSTEGGIAFSSAPVDPEHEYGEICREDQEIYVMNADGTAETQLTNNSEQDVGPAWSRDDRKIAFTRYHDGKSDIYVMNADGTGQTRLTNQGFDSNPSWSP